MEIGMDIGYCAPASRADKIFNRKYSRKQLTGQIVRCSAVAVKWKEGKKWFAPPCFMNRVELREMGQVLHSGKSLEPTSCQGYRAARCYQAAEQ